MDTILVMEQKRVKKVTDNDLLKTLCELKGQTVSPKYRYAIDEAITSLKKDTIAFPILCGNKYSQWYSCPHCYFPVKHYVTRQRFNKSIRLKKEEINFQERCNCCGQFISWDPKMVDSEDALL